MYAAELGHTEAVATLIEAEADVDVVDDREETALMKAANSEIVRMLIEKGNADVNFANKNGDTALMMAATEGRTEVVAKLIELDVKVDGTLLIIVETLL